MAAVEGTRRVAWPIGRLPLAVLPPKIPDGMTEPLWAERIRRATNPDNRWNVLMAAGGWYIDRGEEETASRYFQQALAVAQQFAPRDLRYVDTLVKLAEVGASEEEVRSFYMQALQHLERVHGPRHLRVAEILERLVEVDRADTKLPDKIRHLERAWRIREHHKIESDPGSLRTLERLARFYEHAGRLEAALQAMQRAVALYDAQTNQHEVGHAEAIMYLAELYTQHGKRTMAYSLLQQRIVQWRTPEDWWRTEMVAQFAVQLGWLHAQHKEWPAAQKMFEEAWELYNTAQRQGNPTIHPTLAVPYVLDLCYIHLQQGRHEAAHTQLRLAQRLAQSGAMELRQMYNDTSPQDAAGATPGPVDWITYRRRAHVETMKALLGVQ